MAKHPIDIIQMDILSLILDGVTNSIREVSLNLSTVCEISADLGGHYSNERFLRWHHQIFKIRKSYQQEVYQYV